MDNGRAKGGKGVPRPHAGSLSAIFLHTLSTSGAPSHLLHLVTPHPSYSTPASLSPLRLLPRVLNLPTKLATQMEMEWDDSGRKGSDGHKARHPFAAAYMDGAQSMSPQVLTRP